MVYMHPRVPHKHQSNITIYIITILEAIKAAHHHTKSNHLYKPKKPKYDYASGGKRNVSKHIFTNQ